MKEIELLSETDSNITNNSFEDEVGFVDQMDYINEIDNINEIDYDNVVNLENSDLKRQKIEEEQSETEASTSTFTKKSNKAVCEKCKAIKNGKKCRYTINTEGSTSNIKHHLLNIHGLTETTILDLCNKRINKATAIDWLKAKSFLNIEYELLKSDELEANIQNNLEENKKNKLLHAMYSFNLQKEEQKNSFSVLSQLAKKYLKIATTFTSSEWLFLDTRNIMTNKRTCLSSKLFETIVFLKRNIKVANSLFPNNN
ncbi:15244_t:CDS:2 [Cetraspora pellucida]|uniref:15244_t:CDS:1 n=1 Tax=Cetraspora pellucida TaxID=1433469 RepID=A0A9N9IQ08_9GLOM|nr:15244_t:CDS:2 [Cetraspora pellucida]